MRDKAMCFTNPHCEWHIEYFWLCTKGGFLAQPFGLTIQVD